MKFFRSIAGKVTAVLALCILALVAINWLLNSFALLDNYEREQRTLLTRGYTELENTARTQSALSATLKRYKTEYGVDSLLWSDTHLLYSSRSLDTPPFGTLAVTPLRLPNGTYTVSNQAPPLTESNEQWLTLSARTADGLNAVLWVSLADIHSGTAISNRFLFWSGLVTLLLGAVAAVLLARSFTRPVRRLSGMAARMAQLDFSDRYIGTGNDELAELGYSLNTVSETLEHNLSELKTANAHLQNDRDRQARQAEAQAHFIRNVSHELKTPIALIQSYAEGLHENAAADAESRDYYCAVIEDEAQKLSQILAKLTVLMQLESGGEELAIDRFDIGVLLRGLLARYAPLFEEKGVALPTLPDIPCTVWGDAVLIENVATNYLTNALNHVSRGGDIRITWESTDRDTVVVRVFNTGTPIPEEELPHIWESFYKVDKARTRAYGGTGIGLSVVAAIMHAHRMPYGVHNTPDGVCFFFELSAK